MSWKRPEPKPEPAVSVRYVGGGSEGTQVADLRVVFTRTSFPRAYVPWQDWEESWEEDDEDEDDRPMPAKRYHVHERTYNPVEPEYEVRRDKVSLLGRKVVYSPYYVNGRPSQADDEPVIEYDRNCRTKQPEILI